MSLGILTLQLLLPGCTSLKEKRSRLKSLLARLHREFNVSSAEVGRQDDRDEALIACALVSNDAGFTQKALQQTARWVEENWPDVSVADEKYELISI